MKNNKKDNSVTFKKGDLVLTVPLYLMKNFHNSFFDTFKKESSSSIPTSKSRKDTIVHTFSYQNINGKENTKEEKYVINKDGKKKPLPIKKK